MNPDAALAWFAVLFIALLILSPYFGVIAHAIHELTRKRHPRR